MHQGFLLSLVSFLILAPSNKHQELLLSGAILRICMGRLFAPHLFFFFSLFLHEASCHDSKDVWLYVKAYIHVLPGCMDSPHMVSLCLCFVPLKGFVLGFLSF